MLEIRLERDVGGVGLYLSESFKKGSTRSREEAISNRKIDPR